MGMSQIRRRVKLPSDCRGKKGRYSGRLGGRREEEGKGGEGGGEGGKGKEM